MLGDYPLECDRKDVYLVITEIDPGQGLGPADSTICPSPFYTRYSREKCKQAMNDECKKQLLCLGKRQIDALFARQKEDPEDDSKFVPLVEMLITTFEKVGLDAGNVKALWQHAYETYDRHCREVDPEYTFEESRELMASYLTGNRKKKRG